MEKGRYHFLQHLPKGRYSDRLEGTVFSRYPAGAYGRVKKMVDVYESNPTPMISIVKVIRVRDNPKHVMDLKKEAEGLQTLNHHLASMTREPDEGSKKHYLHQIFFQGKPLDRNQFTMRRLAGFRTKRFYDNLVLSGLANLSIQFDKGLLHLDIKESNVLVTPSGRSVLIDYGMCAGFKADTVGTQRPRNRLMCYRRDELLTLDEFAQTAVAGPADDLLSFALTVCENMGLYRPPWEATPEQIRQHRDALPERLEAYKYLSKDIKTLLQTILKYRHLHTQGLTINANNGVLNPLPGLITTKLSPQNQQRFQEEKVFAAGYIQQQRTSSSAYTPNLTFHTGKTERLQSDGDSSIVDDKEHTTSHHLSRRSHPGNQK